MHLSFLCNFFKIKSVMFTSQKRNKITKQPTENVNGKNLSYSAVVVGIKYILLLVFVIVVIVALVLYVGSVFCVFVVVLYWYRCGNVYVV